MDSPLRDGLRIGCGVISACSASGLAAVRNADNVDAWVPRGLYIAWGVFFALYAVGKYFNVRGINNGPVINGPERRVNCETLIVTVIIFVMAVIIALSSGTSTLLDVITIYGPLVLTAAVYIVPYCIIDLGIPAPELVITILGGGW